MNVLKSMMQSYVTFLQKISDPFGVGVHVHLTLFFINWFIVYIIIRKFTKKSKSDFRKGVYERAGIFSFIFGYLLSVVFIWLKNN